MKDELGGQIMKKFVGLQPKTQLFKKSVLLKENLNFKVIKDA